MDWNSKLQEIKQRLNLKTVEFAQKVGIPPQSIIDIEKGRVKNPSANLIKGLILNLEINPFWLFSDSDCMFINETSQVKENINLKDQLAVLSREKSEKSLTIEDALPILKKLSKMNNIQKEQVMQFIDSLSNK